MLGIQSKITISFLPVLVTNMEVVKTETCFLKICYSYLNNSFFYCNCSIKFGSNFLLLCPNYLSFDHCFLSNCTHSA